MTILVVQNTAGTTALNGTAPDPTNVPGNNWFASNASFKRNASGGVLIPDGSFVTGNLAYNVGTARHKIKISSLTLSNAGSYVRLLINKSTLSASPFDSTAGSSGYGILIQASSTIVITTWTNGSAPAVIGATVSSALPSSLPLTVTDIFIEHFVNGTINASATVGGTTYTSTVSGISSPLSGTIAGLFGASNAATNVTATELVIEDASVAYSTRITWAEAQYQASGVPSVTDYSSPMSRGIFRGIERGVA